MVISVGSIWKTILDIEIFKDQYDITEDYALDLLHVTYHSSKYAVAAQLLTEL